MSKTRLIAEFFDYLRRNKKLWLLPILLILGLVSIAIIVSQSQAIAPFIYALF